MNKYNIGDIIKEVEIIDIFKKNHRTFYKCKCLKCQRIRNIRNDSIDKRMTTHADCGYMIDKSDKKFYCCWRNMRQRTTNPNANEYENYGGRGINSDYYKNFVDFYDELYESYRIHCEEYGEKNTTLDRINTNGNYEKGNIKWSTIKEQNENLLTTYLVECVYNKQILKFNSLNDFCKFFHVHSDTVRRKVFGNLNKTKLPFNIKLIRKYKQEV